MALGNGALVNSGSLHGFASYWLSGFNGPYRYGLKQRIVNGYQIEIPDDWFGSLGNVTGDVDHGI